MNKYELALVVSAKLEDEARDAVVEKAKSYITRYNGVITEVEEWGKKKLAYEIQKMKKDSTTSFSSMHRLLARQKLRNVFVSQTMSSVICVFAKTHKNSI